MLKLMGKKELLRLFYLKKNLCKLWKKNENVCRVSACLFIRKHVDIAYAHCIQEKLAQIYCDIS